MTISTPIKTRRDSNLELFRIIVMLLIVAHHYVVNSGLFGVIKSSPMSVTSSAMLLFGAWGKTGINCFVLITGYFMCKSKISTHKFLKLYTQILFYGILFYITFGIAGYYEFSPKAIIPILVPIHEITSNFVGCFLIFYLLIPFLNILLGNLNKRQHTILIAILLLYQTILPIIPTFNFSFNYVGWFSTLFIIAAYIRFYGLFPKMGGVFWGITSCILITFASLTVILNTWAYNAGYVSSFLPYYFMSDSNMILAVLIGISTFMWAKTIKMSYIGIINKIGGATFAVLLIHANSNTMRQWLWEETIRPAAHLGDAMSTLMYATVSVLVIFSVCILIEWGRLQLGRIRIFSINYWLSLR